jgi:hypothetical protein
MMLFFNGVRTIVLTPLKKNGAEPGSHWQVWNGKEQNVDRDDVG